MIDWKSKLSSRKFWAMVAGFVTPLLLAFGLSESIVTEIVSIITAGSAIIVYIFAESSVDKAREESFIIDDHIEDIENGN